ncbi:hypothetical protein M514_00155 [Trichuris suis]|uniref:Ku domain-containing protein n=1 Tax=Trichuris suis TaxID=68888 RepID=A0A085NU78_9BILA|nr:hypothetical protein M514_00155 [Trichuris suis]
MSYNKEAIIVCLDVGPSMRAEEKGVPPLFHAAIECVKWILKRRIFAESSDEVALLLFGSDASNNPYVELGKAAYQNISLASELKTVDWDLFESVCQLQDTKCGADVDFCRALTVAATYLVQATQAKRFAQRSIVLLSCFSAHVTTLDTALLETLTDARLELAVIGPDESDTRSRNVAMVQSLVDSVSGIYCPFNQATSLLGLYQRRSIKPVAWKCDLEFGTQLRIPVCSYVKCRSYHLKQGWKFANAQCPYMDVTMERTYHSISVDDDGDEDNSEQKPMSKWLGEEICERDLVKAEQLNAVDSLILAMDLMHVGKNAEDEPFKWSNINDPHFQYFFSCMEKRAMHPEEPLLPMDDRFLAPISPLDEIMKRSGPCLNVLKEQFRLEHLGRKKSKRAAAEVFKAEDSVTTLQQIAQEHKGEGPAKVGTVDPVNDFHQMVKLGRSFVEACEQFVEVILHLMFEAHDSFFLRKASHCAAVLRKSCIQERTPNIYNRFLERIKHEALENAGRIVWVSSLLADDLGPISSAECSSSELSVQDAADFFKEIDATKAPVKSEQLSAISTDLINELE